MPNCNFPQVLITPLKPALNQGMAQKSPVLVLVSAPDAPPSEKPVRKSLYSARKMQSRLSAKEEVIATSAEGKKASYLRRKKAQGKAQFDDPDQPQP